MTEEEGRKLADDFGMNFFETSAKTNQNVNEVFTFLTQEILKNMKSRLMPGADNGVKINNKKNQKKGCCK